MANVGDVTVRLTANTAQFTKSLATAQQKLQAFGTSMVSIGTRLSVGLSLPLVLVGRSALKAGIDFESAFTGVRKTVNATEREFKILEQSILEMARVVPTAATEIAGVAEAAGQLGIRNENIIGFSKTMIDLGETTDIVAREAATAFALLANITDLAQSDFDKLGSVVVGLGNTMVTTESSIIGFAKRIAGAGNQVGLTSREIIAFSASLSSVGLQTQAGGTAISRVFVELAKAVQTGGEELQTFADTAGQSTEEFSKAFQEDAAEATITFIEGLKRISDEGRNVFKVLDDLGLADIRVRDSLLLASNAGDLFRAALANANVLWEENLALAREAELRYGTTESRLNILGNQLTEIGIIFSKDVNPFVGHFVQSAEGMLKGLRRMDTATRNLVLAIGAIVVVIGPVILAFGLLIRFVTPLALLAGAAFVLGSAAIFIAANWEKLGPIIKAIGKELGNIVLKDVESILDGMGLLLTPQDLQRLEDASGAIKQFVQGIIDEPWESAKRAFSEISTAIAEALGRMKQDFLTEFPSMTSHLELLGEWFEWVKKHAKLMVDMIIKGWDTITEKIGSDTITKALEKVGQAYEDVTKRINEAISQTGLAPLAGGSATGSEEVKEVEAALHTVEQAAMQATTTLKETDKVLEKMAQSGRTLGSLDVFNRGAKFAGQKQNPLIQFPGRDATEFEATLERVTADLEGIKRLTVLIQQNTPTAAAVEAMSGRDFGQLVAKMRDVSAAVQAVVKEMGDNLSSETQKFLTDMVKHFIDFQNVIVNRSIVPDTIDDVVKVWREGMGTMEEVTAESLGVTLQNFNQALPEIEEKLSAFASASNFVGNLLPEGSELRAQSDKFFKALEEIFGGADVLGNLGTIKGIAEEIQKTKAALNDALQSVESLEDAWKAYQKELKTITASTQALGNLYEALPDKIAATRQALVAMQLAINEAGGLGKLHPAVQVQTIEQMAELREQMTLLQDTAAIEDAFIGLGNTLSSTIDSMLQGVLRGTQTMKEAFRNMVVNILASLASNALKNAITGIFSQVATLAGQQFGGSGAGGVLSMLFGSGIGQAAIGGLIGAGGGAFTTGGLAAAGAGAAARGSANAALFGPGFAAGGSMAAGQLGMVGERGPELFMPKTAGTIIPNHALMSKEPTVEINIINKSSAKVTNSESMDGMRRQIDIMVVDAIQRDMAQGGKGSQAISQTFGLNRSGVRR